MSLEKVILLWALYATLAHGSVGHNADAQLQLNIYFHVNAQHNAISEVRDTSHERQPCYWRKHNQGRDASKEQTIDDRN